MSNPWNQLEKPNIENEIKAIRIKDNKFLKLFWGVDFNDNKLLLFIPSKPEYIKNLKSKHFKGISFYSDMVNNQAQVRIVLNDSSKVDLFYLICRDIVDNSIAISTEIEFLKYVYQRIEQWRELLLSNHKKLNKKQVIGLIAELCFLKNILFKQLGVKEALDSWIAPEGNTHDFCYGNKVFEVKSRSNENKVMISSKDQLKSNLHKLYLFVITITESSDKLEDSLSIADLLSNIRDEIRNYSIDQLIQFEKQLIDYGFTQNSDILEFCFYKGEYSYYLVDQNFPKIIDVDDRIIEVNYKINLNNCLESNYELIWSDND